MKTKDLILALNEWGAQKGFSLSDMCIRRPYKNNIDVIINDKKYSLIFDVKTKKIKDV